MKSTTSAAGTSAFALCSARTEKPFSRVGRGEQGGARAYAGDEDLATGDGRLEGGEGIEDLPFCIKLRKNNYHSAGR